MSRIAALSLSVALAFACGPVLAQWAWKDAKGTTVFSDQPPPSDVKPAQIIRRPAAGSTTPSSPAPSGAAPASAESPAPKTAAQMDAEFRQRQTERTEAEKKAADTARLQQQLAERCNRARTSLQAVEEGLRVRSPATGGVMEDAERATEAARLRKLIADVCK